MQQGVALRLQDATRSFRLPHGSVSALDSVSLSIESGEFVSIMGRSGSGKSTLLNVLGCLDRLSSGKYFINGADTTDKTRRELTRIRRDHFGFIFQAYHLLTDETALQNIAMPLAYAGVSRRARQLRARQLLRQVGLEDAGDRLPGELSGGQQQRIAIARAMSNRPSILLADEPTGNLDSASGDQVLDLLVALNQAGSTLILVTHDEGIGAMAHRRINLVDGRVTADIDQRGVSART